MKFLLELVTVLVLALAYTTLWQSPFSWVAAKELKISNRSNPCVQHIVWFPHYSNLIKVLEQQPSFIQTNGSTRRVVPTFGPAGGDGVGGRVCKQGLGQEKPRLLFRNLNLVSIMYMYIYIYM